MKFTTLIPTCRNDGSPVSDAELQAILQGIATRFGGYSIEGSVDGHWIDDRDGKQYADKSLKLSVACDAARLGDAEAEVISIGRRLGQEAMFFEVRYFDGVRFLRITQ